MAALIDTLGQRILQTARMAVAVHLKQVAESELHRGQRVVIGRAGPQMRAAAQQADAAGSLLFL